MDSYELYTEYMYLFEKTLLKALIQATDLVLEREIIYEFMTVEYVELSSKTRSQEKFDIYP